MVGTVRGLKDSSWDMSIGTHTRPNNHQQENREECEAQNVNKFLITRLKFHRKAADQETAVQ